MSAMSMTKLLVIFFISTVAAIELNCIACQQGFFYNGINNTHGRCERCPVAMTTFALKNITSQSQCVCNVTFTNTSYACIPCSQGTFKNFIGNESCVDCPDNSYTLQIGAFDVNDCVCNPGFSNVPNTDICQECEPGFFKSDYGDVNCIPCPANTFCPRLGTATPSNCPSNSVSNMYSVRLFDCTCRPGFRYQYQPEALLSPLSCLKCEAGLYQDHFNQSACKPCRADTYNPEIGANSSSFCLDCPVHSSSLEQSTQLTDCVCNLGYAGQPGDTCIPCAQGKYLDNLNIYECKNCPANTFNDLFAQIFSSSCLACGQNKTSVSGSGSQFNCVCDPGFEFVRGEYKYTCEECERGKFAASANTSSCALCPRGTFQDEFAKTICLQCPDGQYSDVEGSIECEFCGFGKYQIIDDFFSIGQTVEERASTSFLNIKATQCTACPEFSSHVQRGSTTINDCLCVPGYRAQYQFSENFFISTVAAMFLSHCELCEPGSFCVGGGQGQGQELCPLNHFSQAGAAQCTRCHPHSFGSQIINFTECLCLAGYEGSYHDNCLPCRSGTVQPTNFSGRPCQACSQGKYQSLEGQLECNNCPINSNTITDGNSHVTQCICKAGYYGRNGGPCELCPQNKYCPGGTVFLDCPDNTQSLNGSGALTDCTCRPGFTALENGVLCHRCPPDSFCPGGTEQISCSDSSSSVEGTASIEGCICDPGLWRGCIITANGTQMNRKGVCVINYTLPCVSCKEDVICVNNTLLHCPQFSTSPEQSSHPSDCICNDGFYAYQPFH